MVVVGGSPGSGKSTAFPVRGFGVDGFNVDDAAAHMNGGSYQNIPPGIRAEANRQCEQFIAEHIRERKSFAVETTLRTDVAFRQAAEARAHGFKVEFTYVAAENVETSIKRVIGRARRGGRKGPQHRSEPAVLATECAARHRVGHPLSGARLP